MPKAEMYHEVYRVNQKTPEQRGEGIHIYCAMLSRWAPGFVSRGDSGEHAVYSLVKSGRSLRCSDPGSAELKAPFFVYGRFRKPMQPSRSLGPEDLVRKVILLYQDPLHDTISSHFLPRPSGTLPLTDPEKVEKIFDSIYSEMGNKTKDDALLAGLFLQLLQEVSSQQQKYICPPALQKVLTFISENLDSPELSRELIASSCGMGVRTLCRLFNRELKIPVGQYIINTRMEKVCSMLALPGLPVKEIASACGFRNPGFLSTSFHRIYGKTPLEYRSIICGKK